MIQQFLKEGSIYTLSNFATKGISLLLIPFYTAYFSPADYGILDYLSVLSGVINAIFSLQIAQGVSRYLGDDSLSELEKRKLGATGINAIFIVYFLTAVFLLLTQHFWKTISETSSNEFTDSIFQLMIINTCINALFFQFGIHLRFRRKTVAFAWLSFIQSLANIALILTLVIYGQMGIEAIYWASTIIAPFIVGFQLYLLRKEYLFYLGRKELKMILQFSIPLIPAALAMLALDITDRFVIAQKISLNELGVYSLGAKFPSVLTLLIASFSMALAPIVIENYKLESTKIKLQKLIRNYFIIGGILVFILALFSQETIFVFTNSNYFEAHKIMPLLYLIAFINGISMFSLGIFLSNKTYIQSIINTLAAVLNLLLNLWLVPIYGILGATISTLIAISLNVILLFFFSTRFYKFISFSSIAFYLLALTSIIGFVSLIAYIKIDFYMLLVFKILISLVLIYFLWKHFQKNIRHGISK